MSLRDTIIAAGGAKESPLWMPEWNETVVLREMTAGESIALGRLEDGDEEGAATAVVETIIKSVYERDGGRVFEDDDADLVLSLPASVVRRLADAVRELNARTEESVDEAKKG